MQIFPAPLLLGPMLAFQPETKALADQGACFDTLVSAPEMGVLAAAKGADCTKTIPATPEEKDDPAGSSDAETTDDNALSAEIGFPLFSTPTSEETSAARGESQQPSHEDEPLYTTDIASNAYAYGPPSHLSWPIGTITDQRSDELAPEEGISRLEAKTADKPAPLHFAQDNNAAHQGAETPSEPKPPHLVGPHTAPHRASLTEGKDSQGAAQPTKDEAFESQAALGAIRQRAPSTGLSARPDHPVKSMAGKAQALDDPAEVTAPKAAAASTPVTPDLARAISVRPPAAPPDPAARPETPAPNQPPDPADMPFSGIEGPALPLPRHPAFPAPPAPGLATLHPVPAQASTAILHSVKSGETATELTLSPEDLGKIRFEIISNDDKLTVRMFVERPDTLDLVRRQGDQLLAELRHAGFTQTSLSFGNWQQQGRKQADQVGLALRDTSEDRSQGQTHVTHYIPPLAPSGRLNIRL